MGTLISVVGLSALLLRSLAFDQSFASHEHNQLHGSVQPIILVSNMIQAGAVVRSVSASESFRGTTVRELQAEVFLNYFLSEVLVRWSAVFDLSGNYPDHAENMFLLSGQNTKPFSITARVAFLFLLGRFMLWEGVSNRGVSNGTLSYFGFLLLSVGAYNPALLFNFSMLLPYFWLFCDDQPSSAAFHLGALVYIASGTQKALQFTCTGEPSEGVSFVLRPLYESFPSMECIWTLAEQAGPFVEAAMGIALLISWTRTAAVMVCLVFHLTIIVLLCALNGDWYVLDLNVFCALQVLVYWQLPKAPQNQYTARKAFCTKEYLMRFCPDSIVLLTGLRYLMALFAEDANHDYAMDLYGQMPERYIILSPSQKRNSWNADAPYKASKGGSFEEAAAVIRLEQFCGVFRNGTNCPLVNLVRVSDQGFDKFVDFPWVGTDEYPTTLGHAASLAWRLQGINVYPGTVRLAIKPRHTLLNCDIADLQFKHFPIHDWDKTGSDLNRLVEQSCVFHAASFSLLLFWVIYQFVFAAWQSPYRPAA